jgi:hypothetical protein|tara:strand:- start:1986 stop:2381 length:396 start_codon:yes stop_codon:yes gene_type:complete
MSFDASRVASRVALSRLGPASSSFPTKNAQKTLHRRFRTRARGLERARVDARPSTFTTARPRVTTPRAATPRRFVPTLERAPTATLDARRARDARATRARRARVRTRNTLRNVARRGGTSRVVRRARARER